MANWAETKKLIRKHRGIIQSGWMVVIDPASGGGESMPGYALYYEGKLESSGIFQLTAPTLAGRLSEIVAHMRGIFDFIPVLVTEDIRIIRGQFSGQGVYNLLKGVGAVLGAVHSKVALEIPPREWKRSVDKSYTKSDENDAIYLGKYVLAMAAGDVEVEAKEKTKSRKKPSTRKVDLGWGKRTVRKKTKSKKGKAAWVKSKQKKVRVTSSRTSQPNTKVDSGRSKRKRSEKSSVPGTPQT